MSPPRLPLFSEFTAPRPGLTRLRFPFFHRGRGLLGSSRVARPGDGRRMRECDAKDGPLRRSPLYYDLAPVILNDLVHHRQAETGPVLFPLTDERLKQGVPDGIGYTSAVVADSDLNSAASIAKLNLHLPTPRRQRLTSIQQ